MGTLMCNGSITNLTESRAKEILDLFGVDQEVRN